MRTTTIFDHEIRVLICKSCGGPLPTPVDGGTIKCEYCGTTSLIGPRPDVRSQTAVSAAVPKVAIARPPEPPLPEPVRLQQLATQVRERLTPPTSLPWAVMWWNGRKNPTLVARALDEWTKARNEVERGGDSKDAEARLYFLTLAFTNYYGANDAPRMRAMLETAYELCRSKRHQHVLLSRMVRQAASAGDLEAAEQWLADCDPRSSDIYIDTAWRIGRAHIDLLRRDYARVLEVLGDTFGAVPIACAFDQLCALYRADAHEKLGQLDRGCQELARALDHKRTSPRVMWGSVHSQPALGLVPNGLKRVIAPRLRWWKLRHRAYVTAWLGTIALLTSQWVLTRFLDPATLAPARLFELDHVWPAVVILVLGVIPHWRWKP
jgi:DNA-directed RNA polymerase subunit RPC12/RpoP